MELSSVGLALCLALRLELADPRGNNKCIIIQCIMLKRTQHILMRVAYIPVLCISWIVF